MGLIFFFLGENSVLLCSSLVSKSFVQHCSVSSVTRGLWSVSNVAPRTSRRPLAVPSILSRSDWSTLNVTDSKSLSKDNSYISYEFLHRWTHKIKSTRCNKFWHVRLGCDLTNNPWHFTWSRYCLSLHQRTFLKFCPLLFWAAVISTTLVVYSVFENYACALTWQMSPPQDREGLRGYWPKRPPTDPELCWRSFSVQPEAVGPRSTLIIPPFARSEEL